MCCDISILLLSLDTVSRLHSFDGFVGEEKVYAFTTAGENIFPHVDVLS